MFSANLAKTLIGNGATTALPKGYFQHLLRTSANIVYYHFVGQTQPYYADFSGHCSLERFRKDLDLLKSYFTILPLEDLLKMNELGKTPEDPLLSITFDDGFNLVRSGVLSALNDAGLKATVFPITSCIDNASLMWRNKISATRQHLSRDEYLNAFNHISSERNLPTARTCKRSFRVSMKWPMHQKDEIVDLIWRRAGMPPLPEYLDRFRPYMSWDDLRTWLAHGHGIGLHTRTHPVCANLDREEVELEIVAPARELRDKFNISWLPFSYPFGIRLPRTVEKDLYEAGTFDCALGIRGRADIGTPAYQLERAGVEGGVEFPLFVKAMIGRFCRLVRLN